VARQGFAEGGGMAAELQRCGPHRLLSQAHCWAVTGTRPAFWPPGGAHHC